MKVEQDIWDNEGGHMSSARGRMREAEAFIRRNTPRPAERCTLFDRAAGEGLSSKFPNEVSP